MILPIFSEFSLKVPKNSLVIHQYQHFSLHKDSRRTYFFALSDPITITTRTLGSVGGIPPFPVCMSGWEDSHHIPLVSILVYNDLEDNSDELVMYCILLYQTTFPQQKIPNISNFS